MWHSGEITRCCGRAATTERPSIAYVQDELDSVLETLAELTTQSGCLFYFQFIFSPQNIIQSNLVLILHLLPVIKG